MVLPSLRFTSCQAPAAEAFCAAVARHVGRRLGIQVEFVDGMPWQERLREFDATRIHVCWMCGLPYVQRADRVEARVEILVAPVMSGPRYADRPIYFSDVVVRSDSPYDSFAALEGATWAYNEVTSHSGYNATRHRLARMGRSRAFFRKAVAAGSHEASLRLLLAGEVDASAIDSTVLDLLCRRDPGLRRRLRAIDCFGPSPIAPWVVASVVPREMRQDLRKAFLAMSGDPAGREILATGMVARFVQASDGEYDAIGLMDREARGVEL